MKCKDCPKFTSICKSKDVGVCMYKYEKAKEVPVKAGNEECDMNIQVKDDKQMLREIYDAICTALTSYESDEDTDSDYDLYNEVVYIQNKLSEYLN